MHRHCNSINPSNCANSIELALDNWITSMDLHSQLSRLIALSSRKSNRCHLGMRLLIFHAGSNCRSEKGTGCFVKLRKSGIDSLRFPPSEGISISHTFTYSVQIPVYIYPSMWTFCSATHILWCPKSYKQRNVWDRPGCNWVCLIDTRLYHCPECITAYGEVVDHAMWIY